MYDKLKKTLEINALMLVLKQMFVINLTNMIVFLSSNKRL